MPVHSWLEQEHVVVASALELQPDEELRRRGADRRHLGILTASTLVDQVISVQHL